jgi:hypothetical protein
VSSVHSSDALLDVSGPLCNGLGGLGFPGPDSPKQAVLDGPTNHSVRVYGPVLPRN